MSLPQGEDEVQRQRALGRVCSGVTGGFCSPAGVTATSESWGSYPNLPGAFRAKGLLQGGRQGRLLEWEEGKKKRRKKIFGFSCKTDFSLYV